MLRETVPRLIVALCLAGAWPGESIKAANAVAEIEVGPSYPPANHSIGTAGDLLGQLSAPTSHWVDLSEAEVKTQGAWARHYGPLLREKFEAKWFAALTVRDGGEAGTITRRFG